MAMERRWHTTGRKMYRQNMASTTSSWHVRNTVAHAPWTQRIVPRPILEMQEDLKRAGMKAQHMAGRDTSRRATALLSSVGYAVRGGLLLAPLCVTEHLRVEWDPAWPRRGRAETLNYELLDSSTILTLLDAGDIARGGANLQGLLSGPIPTHAQACAVVN